MLRCDKDGKLLPSMLLRLGDKVKMAKGPFANVIATIETVTPDRLVWVLMDIMGGQTRVAVQAGQMRTL